MTSATKSYIMFLMANTVAFFWLGWFGIVQWINTIDITYISLFIIALYAGCVLSLNRELKSQKSKRERFKLHWYVAGRMPALGLLGTVVGLMYGVNSMASIGLDLNDSTQVIALFQKMLLSLGTSLITTVVGLICGLLMQAQILVLDTVDKHESQ